MRECRRSGGNKQSFNAFLFFSAAMVVVPVCTMVLAHTLFLDLFFTFASDGDKVVYSGIAAICSVQLVVALFLIYAVFFEPAGDVPAAPKVAAKAPTRAPARSPARAPAASPAAPKSAAKRRSASPAKPKRQ